MADEQTVSPKLLELMVCPDSRHRLVLHEGWLYSTDPDTRRRYPVRDGIPIMLIDQSEVVEPAEFTRVMEAARSGAPAVDTRQEG